MYNQCKNKKHMKTYKPNPPGLCRCLHQGPWAVFSPNRPEVLQTSDTGDFKKKPWGTVRCGDDTETSTLSGSMCFNFCGLQPPSIDSWI